MRLERFDKLTIAAETCFLITALWWIGLSQITYANFSIHMEKIKSPENFWVMVLENEQMSDDLLLKPSD